MATLTVYSDDYGFDIDGFDFSDLYDADSVDYNSSLYRTNYESGWYDEFRGSGFKFNSYAEPTAGTVSEFKSYYYGDYFTLTGTKMSLADIYDAALTYSTSDDRAIIAKALGGNDTVRGDFYADKLKGFDGNDKLYGYEGNDELQGNDGNDGLYSGSGHDKLSGGAGDDRLSASSGGDDLYGGGGNDLLNGGSGDDWFIFNTTLGSSNIDTIEDFRPGEDAIMLDNDIFTKAGSIGGLKSSAFHVGTKAHDSTDRVIYDKGSGKLYYDADGTGSKKQVQFALLDRDLKLSAGDIDIIG